MLRALDLTETETLEPMELRCILSSLGDTLPVETVDQILKGVPKNSLGRVNCRALAKCLMKGPEGLLRI